ncbi:MAG: hypothetical protein F4039_01830 [Gammaproteobacteria bacterium]|nr:hypothetical protein [Gammaproteobacteria bacterium]MXX95398.1 hypothetical protein [Gammaproteobacteria bacterium]MYF53564.1 hypothetical protein [Gammaproteobacteria bacterium]MYK42814.1 hypothetical protein [Gammaproteobacteria bacterium]
MFNNLFDSFHDTVAKAKNQREELDSLLTISAPRERQFIIAVLIVLLALSAWLMFGNVRHSVIVDGVLLSTEADSDGGEQIVALAVFMKADETLEFITGMQVSIIPFGSNTADTPAIEGEIHTITESQRKTVQTIAVAVSGSFDFASAAEETCQLVVELGHQTPWELFQKNTF